jgi:hypothetical protein
MYDSVVFDFDEECSQISDSVCYDEDEEDPTLHAPAHLAARYSARKNRSKKRKASTSAEIRAAKKNIAPHAVNVFSLFLFCDLCQWIQAKHPRCQWIQAKLVALTN